MFENLKKQQRGSDLGSGRNLFRIFPQVADPKKRIYVLVGLLVLFVMIGAGLNNYRRNADRRPVTEEVPSATIGLSAEREHFSGIPVLDTQLAERITDNGPDARERWEPEAIPYLLLEARHTPSVNAYAAGLFPITPASGAEIDKDSRGWRFQFVRFRGEIESIREENYEDVYGGDREIGQIHRAIVRVGEGEQTVRITLLYPFAPRWVDENDSSPRPLEQLIEDGWIRGRGVFVKNFLDRGPGGETIPTFLVVATLIARDYPTLPVESLESIPFQIIEDDPRMVGDPAREPLLFKRYPQPLFRLIKYAEGRAGQSPEMVEKRKAEKLVPASFDAESYAEIIGQPARYRAKYFGGFGVLVYPPVEYGIEDTDPNDAGIEEFLYGRIYTDRHHLIEYCAPASLAREFKQNHRIRYEGFFYKTRAYPAKGGTDQLSPMLVLTVIADVPLPDTTYTAQIVIAAAFCVGIAVLAFLVVREDKTKSAYRRSRRKKMPPNSVEA